MIERLPLVSIGMPVYNGEKYVRAALDSLLKQTFSDFELIISDNASFDNTENICQEYALADMRIRYIRQHKNIGPVANFQFVADRARGQYFMWAAHDDTWSTEYINAGVRKLIENPAAIAAIGAIEYINNSKQVFEVDYPPYYLNGNSYCRIRNYLKTNITDYLIYGLYRINFISENRLNKKILAPEKLVILKAIIAGGYEDAQEMSLYVKYNSRSRSELKVMGFNPTCWQDFYRSFLMGKAIVKLAPRGGVPSLIWLLLRHRTPLLNRILRGRLRDHPGRHIFRTN